MTRVSQLKKNKVVRINNNILKIKQITSKTLSARASNSIYKLVMEDIKTRQRMEQTYRDEESLEEVELEKQAVQYLYRDGEAYIFMNTEDYTQYQLNALSLEGQVEWLTDGLEGLIIHILENEPIGIVLPLIINIAVKETAPFIKGATATSRSKPAELENGVTILVPEYIESDEMIRVNTEEDKFVSRVKE